MPINLYLCSSYAKIKSISHRWKKIIFGLLFLHYSMRQYGNTEIITLMLLSERNPKPTVNLQEKSVRLRLFLKILGIKPEDKVALLSNNMPNWSSAYFSITFMGAVVVPILPDFSATEVANVLSHSEAKGNFYFRLPYCPDWKDLNQMILKPEFLLKIFPFCFQKNKSIVFDPFAQPEKDLRM